MVNKLGRMPGRKSFQHFLVHGRTCLLIIFYYACSIGLTFFQKHLFKDFKYPLAVVVIHLIIKFIFAGTCREVYTAYKGEPRVTLSWNTYMKRIFPPGVAAVLDIAFSQWSLEFITVTLYTMSKSTALLFILFFAVLFKLEEMRWSIVILVALIAGGLIMFTYKYTQFNLFGFILVISASILSGLRWTLSEIVMRKRDIGLKNPIDMVYHIQPWMMLTLIPLAVVMEGESIATSEKIFRYQSISAASLIWEKVLFGAVLAFLLEVSEFLVVCYSSSLTFSISGVAKEVLTLSLAVHFAHENLSLINKMGLAMCVLGISVHVGLKWFRASAAPGRTRTTTDSISLDDYKKEASAPLLLNADSDECEGHSR